MTDCSKCEHDIQQSISGKQLYVSEQKALYNILTICLFFIFLSFVLFSKKLEKSIDQVSASFLHPLLRPSPSGDVWLTPVLITQFNDKFFSPSCIVQVFGHVQPHILLWLLQLVRQRWDRIHSALMTLSGDIRTTLTQGFWPQSHLKIVEPDTMFFTNRDVHEEFAVDKHYIGFARNWPAPSFHMGVDCYKGYMVLVRARDEEHPKPI